MDELFTVPDTTYLLRVSLRLGAAAMLGGLIGAEREWVGKAAGLRTHMTVAVGCATFVLIAMETGNGSGDLARVIQGITAGVGFLGAGAILKRTDQENIQGLTTAATIWLTAAVGAAAGAGHIALAGIAVAGAFVILTIMAGVERWLQERRPNHPD